MKPMIALITATPTMKGMRALSNPRPAPAMKSNHVFIKAIEAENRSNPNAVLIVDEADVMSVFKSIILCVF